MIRGIHRFVIRIGGSEIRVRGQSASARGNAFTVASTRVKLVDGSKASCKAAIAQGINEIYPK